MSDKTALLSEDERLAQFNLARLNKEARERKWPNLRPVDAATLILLDRSGKTPKVLMGKRHAALKFMPGMFVFPGGRAERHDGRIEAAGELSVSMISALQSRVIRPSVARARRLALAAIRETFEETGLVIGQPGSVNTPASAPWADFVATGHLPDLSGLTFLARAITPPRRPKRFDTRFFLADASAIAHKVEGIISPNSELTELAWLSLPETADLPLPGITRVILADLQANLQAGGPGPGVPAPFYFEARRQFQRILITI